MAKPRLVMGPLAKMHGRKAVRTLVLDTLKADVCVESRAEQDEELEEGGTRYGTYGVISYWVTKGALATDGLDKVSYAGLSFAMQCHYPCAN